MKIFRNIKVYVYDILLKMFDLSFNVHKAKLLFVFAICCSTRCVSKVIFSVQKTVGNMTML
jgi:hypothetical protein